MAKGPSLMLECYIAAQHMLAVKTTHASYLVHSLTSTVMMLFRVQSGLRTILQEGTLLPRTQMLIQNFFSAVSYGVMDPDSAKEKARLKTQEDNRKLGIPDRPVHGLPPRIPVGLDLVDAADARWVFSISFAENLAGQEKHRAFSDHKGSFLRRQPRATCSICNTARCDVCLAKQRCESRFNTRKPTRCDPDSVRVMPVLPLPDHMSLTRCYAHQASFSPSQILTLLLDCEGFYDMMQLYGSLSLHAAPQQDHVIGCFSLLGVVHCVDCSQAIVYMPVTDE